MPINQTDLPKNGDEIAIIHTNLGDLKVRLFRSLVGECVENFVRLAPEYAGKKFYRLVPHYAIMGGDIDKDDGTGGHTYNRRVIFDSFHDELTNIKGAVGWVKSTKNKVMQRGIDSRFYIVLSDDCSFLNHRKNDTLDNGYTVFGQVFDSDDVLENIAKAEVSLNKLKEGGRRIASDFDIPLNPIIISQVEITRYQNS